MRQTTGVAAVLALGFGLAALGRPARAQPKTAPIKLTAEQLVKECAADRAKAEAKYKGKTLRVTGVVGSIYDDMLYLPVKKTGGSVDVGIRYGKGNKPPVKTGDRATFEGTFDRVAVLGPALVKCKLVKDAGKGK